jgi:hypothetical protein
MRDKEYLNMGPTPCPQSLEAQCGTFSSAGVAVDAGGGDGGTQAVRTRQLPQPSAISHQPSAITNANANATGSSAHTRRICRHGPVRSAWWCGIEDRRTQQRVGDRRTTTAQVETVVAVASTLERRTNGLLLGLSAQLVFFFFRLCGDTSAGLVSAWPATSTTKMTVSEYCQQWNKWCCILLTSTEYTPS